jgi:hypothetical protein
MSDPAAAPLVLNSTPPPWVAKKSPGSTRTSAVSQKSAAV